VPTPHFISEELLELFGDPPTELSNFHECSSFPRSSGKVGSNDKSWDCASAVLIKKSYLAGTLIKHRNWSGTERDRYKRAETLGQRQRRESIGLKRDWPLGACLLGPAGAFTPFEHWRSINKASKAG